MSKHTPGPWTRSYSNYIYQGKDTASKGRLVAICEPTTRTQEDWDQVFANARLMAAAPELLEALELVQSSYCLQINSQQETPEMKKARTMVGQAILKAKGGHK